MEILIAADIFGHTPALERLTGRLHADAIKIIDPYDDRIRFRDEAAAYAFFKDRVGVPLYAKKIAGHIKKVKPNQTLIGFSVGAAAIWYLSSDRAFSGIQQSIGFYGSQIRHHIRRRPVFDTRLIFPESEPGFDVDRLMSSLKEIPKVSCHKAGGRHGFMNERSKNFDIHLYEAFLKELDPEKLRPTLK